MELEKIYNKRARENDHHYEDQYDCPYKNSAKKQDLKGTKTLDSYIDFKENSDDSSNMKTLDSSLALEVGVFDFPWLKDGVISKSEDYRFEDAFFSSLIYDMNPTNNTDIEFSGKSLCQTSEELLYLPENKSDDNLFRPVPEGDGSEMEGVDCIWSSLLSQPLQQGGVI